MNCNWIDKATAIAQLVGLSAISAIFFIILVMLAIMFYKELKRY